MFLLLFFHLFRFYSIIFSLIISSILFVFTRGSVIWVKRWNWEWWRNAFDSRFARVTQWTPTSAAAPATAAGADSRVECRNTSRRWPHGRHSYVSRSRNPKNWHTSPADWSHFRQGRFKFRPVGHNYPKINVSNATALGKRKFCYFFFFFCLLPSLVAPWYVAIVITEKLLLVLRPLT